MAEKVKVGIIGSGFEADIHAAAFKIMPEEAEVVAVASPSPGHAEELGAVLLVELGQVGGVADGHHEQVPRVHRPDVEEGRRALVAVDEARRLPAGQDLAKGAVLHGLSSRARTPCYYSLPGAFRQVAWSSARTIFVQQLYHPESP